jgi:hypothetical protein
MNVFVVGHWCYFFDFSHYFIIAFTFKGFQDILRTKKRCNCIGFKIRFINRVKEKCLYTIHSKVLNGELEYAKLTKILYLASEEVVPQELSASKEEIELRNE